MIPVPERAGQRADTAARGDELLMAGHVRSVRAFRTSVNNVETVRAGWYTSDMPNTTTGDALIALKTRTGLSLEAIAKLAGYKGRSSVQGYFTPEYDKPLDTAAAQKLADALEERGTPPIQRSEVLVLTGALDTNATVLRYEGAADVVLPRNIPIFGTALGAPRDFDGKSVEQTMLNTDQIIGYLPRPTVLNGHDHVYGLYVQGSSMYPRFSDGDTIFVQNSLRGRPPRIGDDVVIYLRDMDVDDGETAAAVLVKRLVRRSASWCELEQFSPAMNFRIEADRVLRVDRVIPWGELLS